MTVGVELVEVSKAFGNTVVVSEINLQIQQGEFVVIVGPSGCGKSTTLRMICGLEPVSSGRIHIKGRDVTYLQPKARDIAMVFQSYALYPHMNVAGNMSFALRLAGEPKSEIKKRVQIAAEMLELTELLDRKPRDLSGGQRQRVAMGRSIVRDAYCFLFDEPLSNLDAKLRSSMRTELALLHKKLQRTMIYVTHDQIEAMTMADRIVIMNEGRVMQVGTPREVYNAPNNLFVAGFIGSPAMNLLNAEICSENGSMMVKGDGFTFPLTQSTAARLTNHASDTREVIVGLRPEHFYVSPQNTEANGIDTNARVELSVNVAEYIGSSQFLAAQISQQPVTATIEVGPDAEPMMDGTYFFDTNRLYLFDRSTQQAL